MCIVQQISQCFIHPKYNVEESKEPIYLPPWDLSLLSINYNQKGLLYKKLPITKDQEEEPITRFLEKLKDSLSLTLVLFFPLAGRLATLKEENPHSYVVFIDCNDSPGAKFVHATANVTISDVVSPAVPSFVHSFFDMVTAINHDGHTMPLLSIQVTELVDGIFVGCSMNHALADGNSLWHFFEVWSEIFKAGGNMISISRPPIHKRWLPHGYSAMTNLPFDPREFTSRYKAPDIQERFFQFSSPSIEKLKAKANAEASTHRISSLQALCALVWRCVTRVRDFPPEKVTNCRILANNRARLNPPLSENLFCNAIQSVRGTSTGGELLQNSLGWAALLLHEAIKTHDSKAIIEWIDAWYRSPHIVQLGETLDSSGIWFGSSPKFKMYATEFGLGKAIAIRSGYVNKFDGKMTLFPGYEGGGSIDVEVCLAPNTMRALEFDKEFMDVVSVSNQIP